MERKPSTWQLTFLNLSVLALEVPHLNTGINYPTLSIWKKIWTYLSKSNQSTQMLSIKLKVTDHQNQPIKCLQKYQLETQNRFRIITTIITTPINKKFQQRGLIVPDLEIAEILTPHVSQHLKVMRDFIRRWKMFWKNDI